MTLATLQARFLQHCAVEKRLRPMTIKSYRSDWILNLVDNVLEVYREPVADPHRAYGWRYASTATLRRGDSVTPLALPGCAIPISDLLP